MNDVARDSQNPFEELAVKIKDNWRRLTDEDVALYEGNQTQFFIEVQEKYGLLREEVEDRIREMEEAGDYSGTKAA